METSWGAGSLCWSWIPHRPGCYKPCSLSAGLGWNRLSHVTVSHNAEISCLGCMSTRGCWPGALYTTGIFSVQKKAVDGQLLLGYRLLVVVLLGQDRTAEQNLVLTPLRTNVAMTALGTLASTAYLPCPTQRYGGSPLGLGASTVLMGTDFPVSDAFQGKTQCEGVGSVQ